MDEYIESVATTARVPRFKIWINTCEPEIWEFILRCEKYEDFRNYYFHPKFTDFPDIFGTLHLCFNSFPNLYKVLSKFPAVSTKNVIIGYGGGFLGSSYSFRVKCGCDMLYLDTGYIGNTDERLKELGFTSPYERKEGDYMWYSRTGNF